MYYHVATSSLPISYYAYFPLHMLYHRFTLLDSLSCLIRHLSGSVYFKTDTINFCILYSPFAIILQSIQMAFK